LNFLDIPDRWLDQWGIPMCGKSQDEDLERLEIFFLSLKILCLPYFAYLPYFNANSLNQCYHHTKDKNKQRKTALELIIPLVHFSIRKAIFSKLPY
jgi:hypothetical protein